jgi:hypothetical protein
MSKRQRRLLRAIECAFRGVELGEGVSLHETVVIDHYGSPEARQAARAPDEKKDWRKLVDDPELEQITGVGGMCFYDAAGLRFHLPAYLSWVVIHPRSFGGILDDLLNRLTDLSEYNLERFAPLNSHQRSCVRDVLLYLRNVYRVYCEEDEALELDQAIRGYWSVGPPATEHA